MEKEWFPSLEEYNPGITKEQWIISSNPEIFDAVSAFNELGIVDWKQSQKANFSVGDIVYIYISHKEQQIKLKTEVLKINIPTNEIIDDSKFYLNKDKLEPASNFMKLKLIKNIKGSAFTKEALELFDFKSPQGPIKIKGNLKEYLSFIEYLQNKTELIPNTYDASYELVTEVVKSYAKMQDLSECDYNDLDLIYLSTVGTWKHSVEKKIDSVNKSNLPQIEKERLIAYITNLWERVQAREFSHCEEESKITFGMFGTGFYTTKTKTDSFNAQKLIQMCIDLLAVDNDEKAFEIVEKNIVSGFKGLAAGGISVILHCLKPFLFPILNSNQGKKNIFEKLGIKLSKTYSETTYIENSRKIKEYRDSNFNWKNYRIFDKENFESLQGDSQMEKQYWLIAPGENAKKWDEYSKNGEIGIGWEELGNIEKYDSDYESFQNDYIKTYKSENDNYKGSSPKQIWDFYKNISIGDIIFARNGVRQIIGMGKVISDYIYDDSRDEYKQIRKVEWEKIGEWKYPGQSSRDTVHRLKPEQAKEILKIMNSQMAQEDTLVKKYANLLKNTKNLILTGAPGTGKTYLAKQIAKELGCKDDNIGFVQFHPSYDYTDFVEGLRPTDKDGNGNVGFERRDGVFKEFCERALKNLVDSRKSVDVLQHERTINEIVEDFLNDAVEKKTQFETQTKNPFSVESFTDRKVFVSIPQNEKVKTLPIPIDDILELISNDVQLNIGKDVSEYFNRKWRTQQDSYIYVLTKQIQKNVKENKNNETVTMEKIQAKNFVFIIDEINRGEVAKIFGELFYSVDPGYRVTSDDLNAIKNGNRTITTIKTQYANLETEGNEFDKVLQKKEKDFGHFFIPENVYIIGTMNDIDRSVESMDFAFRRRFTWAEVKAEDTQYMLEAELDAVLADEAKRRMENLNSAISEINGLNEAYHIGASYFLKLKNYDGDFESLWEYHIKGILQEYLRGNPDGKLDDLKAAYDREEEK